MTTTIETRKLTEADAEQLERDAGYIVAELTNPGRPRPINTGADHRACCELAAGLARRHRGSVYGVFKVTRTFQLEAPDADDVETT